MKPTSYLVEYIFDQASALPVTTVVFQNKRACKRSNRCGTILKLQNDTVRYTNFGRVNSSRWKRKLNK